MTIRIRPDLEPSPVLETIHRIATQMPGWEAREASRDQARVGLGRNLKTLWERLEIKYLVEEVLDSDPRWEGIAGGLIGPFERRCGSQLAKDYELEQFTYRPRAGPFAVCCEMARDHPPGLHAAANPNSGWDGKHHSIVTWKDP